MEQQSHLGCLSFLVTKLPIKELNLLRGYQNQLRSFQLRDTSAVRLNRYPRFSGTMLIEPISFRIYTDIRWFWGLSIQDIFAIEAHRRGNDLQVALSLRGIYQDDDGNIFHFFGRGSSTIAASEWNKVLEKYTMANNHAIPVPPSLFNDQSWSSAVDRLKSARELLSRGETRFVLKACLDQLESYVTNPYARKNWEPVLDDSESAQRREGLIALFAGLSTYLNKVGHHRSQNEREVNSGLIEMPIDHYEAELSHLITHLAIVYLERLKTIGTLRL